jgi:hypothetical protein
LHYSCLVSAILFITCFLLCRDDEEPPKDGIAAPSISHATADKPADPDIAPRVTRASVKKIPQARSLKCSNKAKEADVSLEAHASMVPPDDVSNSLSLIFLVYTYTLTRPFSQTLLKRFVALGTECAEYLKVTKASKGMFYIQS